MPTRLLFPVPGGSVWARVLQAFVLTSVEAFFALLCLLAGIPVLFDITLAPMAIKGMAHGWLTYSWAAGMVAGGSTTLTGIGKGDYRIERMGVALLAAVASVFTIAIVGLGSASVLGILTYFFFAITMVARYWVLGKLLKLHNQWQEQFFTKLKSEADRDAN